MRGNIGGGSKLSMIMLTGYTSFTPTWIHCALCRIQIRAHKATDDAANIYAILQKLLQSWLHEDYTNLFIITVFFIDTPPLHAHTITRK